MNTHESFQWPFLIAGLIVGLFGWLLYWAGIPIIGGIIGACAGGAIGSLAPELIQTEINPLIFQGVGVVLGAILGVLLMRAIQAYFFFAVGAILGGALVWRLLHPSSLATAPTPDWGMTAVLLLGALTGGLLVVYFRRFLVALTTSAFGVVLVIYGLPPQYQLLGGLVSMVIFVSVQVGLVNRFVEQEDFDRRMRRYHNGPHDRGE